MAHLIEEHDRGIVKGSTWHQLEQYKQVGAYIEKEQALGILAYPLDKVQNLRVNAEGSTVPVESYSIVRTDLDIELASGVGARFHLLNNEVLLDLAYDNLVAQYPQLKIESVGTLKNGAIAFVNMQVDEAYHVRGDQSPTEDRLFWYNPIGIGCYQAGAHSERIQCGNTLRNASMQAAANGSLAKFRHTAGAAGAIARYAADLAGFFLSLDDLHMVLDLLARTGVNGAEVKEFLEGFFKFGESGRSESIAKARQARVLETFESGQGLDGDVATSAYALLNAVTYYYDHLPVTDNRDAASVKWNGLVGGAADMKERAYEALKSLARRRC